MVAGHSSFRRSGRVVNTHLDPYLADGFIHITVKIIGVIDEESLGFDDTGDGGGGQADGAQDASQLLDIGRGVAGFNQAAGEDADKGDLFSQTFDIGGFDTGEVTLFDAAGVETMLEGVHVTELGARAAGGRGHRH
jgi:hypothetical protein